MFPTSFIFPKEYLRYLLALNRIPIASSKKLFNLIRQNAQKSLFDSFDWDLIIDLINKELYEGKEYEGIKKEGIDKGIGKGVDKDLQFAESPNSHILSFFDEAYPRLLREISDPPMVLFVKGDVKRLTEAQIAMVGSRNPTPLGKETAQFFAEHFASMGLTVTSGLALGIDTAAHHGAVLGEAGTIAVLGNGLDHIYPASNRALAEEIVENGALVSEFPMGTEPLSAHFPRRNRIISGLSLGTLVVEAALKSGSLITAKYALEHGREVFAIPGSIHSPLAKGCHALIRQGARLVENVEDVLEEMGPLLKLVSKEALVSKEVVKKKGGKKGRPKTRGGEGKLGSAQKSLLKLIDYDPTTIDTIVLRSQLTAAEVSIMLLELELQGVIGNVSGGYIRLSH